MVTLTRLALGLATLSRNAGEGLFSGSVFSPSPAPQEREGPTPQAREGEGYSAASFTRAGSGSVPVQGCSATSNSTPSGP